MKKFLEKKQQELDNINNAIDHVKETWIANDGGLTWAAGDALNWLNKSFCRVNSADSSNQIESDMAWILSEDEYSLLRENA